MVAGGHLRGFPQIISRAEHRSLLETLKRARPPITFFTDCQQVVDEWNLGITLAQAPRAANADVWREVAAIIADWPAGSLQVKKTLAHATAQAIARGKTSPWQAFWNDAADKAVKAINAGHRVDDRTASRYMDLRARVFHLGLHLARTAAAAMATS